jgi:hypothetical protein
MGWNGTVDGCDECTGTVRDSHGHAWKLGEKKHDYESVDSDIRFSVTRARALNPMKGE